MGKNQAYKAMQRSRVDSGSGGPEEAEDGMVDGSFHSPEWHAARLAGLKTSHTITWEEYKKKQKEEELKKGELEADKDKMMREYRAQLDAERASKLSRGKNHSSRKSSSRKDKDKDKDRDSKKRSSKKRKHSKRYSDSSSSSSSESSSSDDEERESKKSKSRSKRKRKEKKSRSRSKHSSSEDEEADGPLPLSRFFGNSKK